MRTMQLTDAAQHIIMSVRNRAVFLANHSKGIHPCKALPTGTPSALSMGAFFMPACSSTAGRLPCAVIGWLVVWVFIFTLFFIL